MPQRPEDYQSTKNVGGNKLGGTDAGYNDPFAYVKLTPAHAHLGRFRQEKFLRKGHNQSLIGAERLGRRAVRRKLTRAVRAGETGFAQALAQDRPVIAARLARKRAVKEARQTGGDVRSVRQTFKSVVKAARQSPESRRGERIARRPRVAVPRGRGPAGKAY